MIVNNSSILTRKDISALKGIAIIGMLLWHLFFAPNPVGMVYSFPLRFCGIIGDFCVSAFLFASGYGLTISSLNLCHSPKCHWGGRFVFNRLIKFYFNFWFIFIIFVPIGVLVFDIPMTEETDMISSGKVWLKQFFALMSFWSYNSAWWFNTLILKYYVIFPILFFAIKKSPLMTSLLFAVGTISLYFYNGINHIYILIFIVGIVVALYGSEIYNYLSSYKPPLLYGLYILLWIISLVGLYLLGEEGICYDGMPFYFVITLLFTVGIRHLSSPIIKGLDFLGRHSGNIYMLHSFLYYYWFPDYFFSLSPLVMFLELLLISLLISYFIERIKKRLMWNELIKVFSLSYK